MSVGTMRVISENEEIAHVVLNPASWVAKSDFINRLILNNNVLICLLGEKNSGKTTFVNLLKMDFAPQIKSTLITADPLFDRTALLQELSVSLGIKGDLSISNFITKINELKNHRLLIIDDAHHLSAIFIEEILKGLQLQGTGGYFHVCLVSDFSLVPSLNVLAQSTYLDMIHSIELGTLSESETKAYVVQNVLTQLDAEKIITDERIKQFYQLTEGNIAGINRQLAGFFIYKPEKPVHEDKLIRHMSIAAGVFFVAVGIGYTWWAQDFRTLPASLVNQGTDLPGVTIESALSSDIPAHNVAAVRQTLQSTSLRRVDLAVMRMMAILRMSLWWF